MPRRLPHRIAGALVATALASSAVFATDVAVGGAEAGAAPAVHSTAVRSTAVRAATGHTAVVRTTASAHLTKAQRVRKAQRARGKRVVAVAKRYVGKARYRDGGASPKRGFDCSGYTKYVYARAEAGRLPHSAAGQRSMHRMHRVSARKAIPGDLVFYHGSGGVFHVAIYAGHHKQYAAATPRDGIRYQRIWSTRVSYGRLG
ncbi:Cell wall-associated hydrolase, NlpC family [Jatrophihabitans endophyticus]|uniref:Cell wall-associated hydrolase, NlpC family n=1 Tax=Jatrophihabitans endophyticus TaxID=1206085 RepID=A0A1M5KYF8_9ACTN|nr:NlpC/P60 family protein [Jatrophihabitans endophyticus]SHG57529.1 Cell wall-associated hydrolase, NlpC family [Jatrophihabitans endophyticus]